MLTRFQRVLGAFQRYSSGFQERSKEDHGRFIEFNDRSMGLSRILEASKGCSRGFQGSIRCVPEMFRAVLVLGVFLGVSEGFKSVPWSFKGFSSVPGVFKEFQGRYMKFVLELVNHGHEEPRR